MKKYGCMLFLIFIISGYVAAQNVGIGTTLPQTKLHIKSDFEIIRLQGSNHYISFFNNAGIYSGYLWNRDNNLMDLGTPAGSNFPVTISPNTTAVASFLASGNVGIGTTSPLARLHVAENNVLFSAAGDIPGVAGNTPVNGAGRRMMWYSDKAAFRVGYISDDILSDGTQWDKDNIGLYSFASGVNTKANGTAAIATGSSTTSSGNFCTAMGYFSVASGNYSTSIGSLSFATGLGSLALGNSSEATGDFSMVIGKDVTTSNYQGTLIIGDNSVDQFNKTPCFRNNEFRARFDGGYAFFTSANLATGVYMVHGDNAWSAISDSTKKEKFTKTDGEYVLGRISKMRLGSWNYKLQDAKHFRHYGPMAQEFYNAFGHDTIGTIGSDTLINSADMAGVMMIAVQALEKRTAEIQIFQKENTALQQQVTLLNGLVSVLQKDMALLKKEKMLKNTPTDIVLHK